MPGELRASQRPHSADRCQARNPATCKFHGSSPDAAVNRGDVNAFIDAKQSEDKTSAIKSFFNKKEDRSNPPGSLKIEEGDGYAIFMTSDGKFYEKQYDRYGAGVGSRKISGMFTGKLKKAAKAQIAEAWAFHDKMEAQRIAAEERDALPQWKQDKLKFEEAMKVYAPYMAAHDSEGASNARMEETQKALDEYLDANPSTNIKALRYAYYAGSQGMRAEHKKYGFTWLSNEVIAENNRTQNEQE